MTKTVSLGEICEINPTRSNKIDNKMPVTFLAMADLSEDGTILNRQTKLYEEVKKGFTSFQEDDILLAKITPCFENGKGAKANFLINSVGFGSTEFHVLRPKNGILADYIFYATRTASFKKDGKKSMTGSAGQQRITSNFVRNFQIPLPSLDEQRRIAALLDRADALRQKDRQLLAHYDQLAQSLFLDLFGDPVRNEKGWEVNLLENIADTVSGVTKNTRQSSFGMIEAPYMRVANVQDGKLDLTEIKMVSVSRKDYIKYQLQTGDILLTEGGDPDKLGRGAVWHNEIPNCIHQNHIFRVRPNMKTVHPRYLSTLIGSKYGKSYFLRAAKQTTGIASINITQLKNFPAQLPPLTLQNHFATLIEQIEKQKAVVRQQMAASEALFGRLLQESFG